MHTLRAYIRSDELAAAQPFFVITTVLLLLVSALTLFEPPAPMPARRLSFFVGLLLLHLALHWLSAHAATHRRWRLLYLPAQGGLALALALVSQRPELTLALFASLVAATLGLYGLTRLAAAGVAGYLLLTAGAFAAIGGQSLLAEWAPPASSTMALLILFMILYVRQADARKRSQELLTELETAYLQLAGYAARIEDLTLAAERRRMARDLHDTLAQGVAGLVLQLEAANAHLENGSLPRAQAIIGRCLNSARSTLAQSRAAIDDLRLEERTMSAAIQDHVARFTRATAIPCHLTLDLPREAALSSAVVEHAERIIGETFANITRHAQANNVWFAVTQTPEGLLIDVRDDGRGFDVETANRQGHYGLQGMRERARLVGGLFAVCSEPGKGTRLSVTLPLEPA